MGYTYNKLYFTIKNKWSNTQRVVTMSNVEDVRLAHKYVYYKHTTNMEDIVSIHDRSRKNVFTLKGGFRR